MRIQGSSTGHVGLNIQNDNGAGRTWKVGNLGTNLSFVIRDNSVGDRFAIDTSGNFTGSATNDISDARLKENITEIQGALDKIMQIRGVRFTWKKEAKLTDRPQLGVLAQEVETVFPELVLNKSIFGEGYKSVQYGGFVAPIIEAIQELKAEKDTEIAALKARLEALEAKVGRL